MSIRFRSSAHPAGPNGPSCLDLNIYLHFFAFETQILILMEILILILILGFILLNVPYPRSLSSSLSLCVSSCLASPLSLSLAWVNWGGASAKIAYFSSLETNGGQIQRNLRATAQLRGQPARIMYFSSLGVNSGQSRRRLRATAQLGRPAGKDSSFLESGGQFRSKYAPFTSHSAH